MKLFRYYPQNYLDLKMRNPLASVKTLKIMRTKAAARKRNRKKATK